MNSSLYLIQATSSSTQSILDLLKQLYNDQDHVVFFSETLSLLTQTELDCFKHCYCLQSEQSLLNSSLISNFTVLDYTDFADLVLKFERCISLK